MRSQVNMTWRNVPHHHIKNFFKFFFPSDHGVMDYKFVKAWQIYMLW
jgi:hypothetical protein